MRSDDEARLQMAYEAVRFVAPSDAEVQAGVRRAAAAVRRSGVRPRSRRLVAVGVGAITLSAAVVYAAAGAFPHLFDQAGTETARPPAAARAPKIAAPATRPSVEPPAVAPRAPDVIDGSGSAASRTLPSPPPAGLRSKKGGARPAHAAAEEASWRRVDEALARGDDALAATALAQLSEQASDDDTRAKSQLGLAQLALGRGDCARARDHALQVLALKAAAVRHHRRARDVIARCSADED